MIASKGLLLSLLAAFCVVNTANAVGAVEVTAENFATLQKGKNSFLKFLAPW